MRRIRLASNAPIGLLLIAATIAACSAGAEPGWTFEPAPSVTPAPSGSAAASGSAGPSESAAASTSPVPSESAAASTSPAPSESAGASQPAGQALKLAAQNIQFDQPTLSAAAGQAFTLEFTNNDAGVPHDVAIKDATGMEVFKGDIINGVATKQYQVPALKAGTYTFYCVVHSTMTGTLTVQ